MTLLSRGQAWLNRTMGLAAGVGVVYSRGSQSLSLTAWVGRTAFAQAGGQGGAAVIWGDRDYLVLAADLLPLLLPQRGDRIVEVIEGVPLTFELMAPGTEPAWRYSDQSRTLLRLHTKKVG